MRSLLFIIIASASLSAFAQEGNLLIPAIYETPKVLPKGVRSIQFFNTFMNADQKYNNQGVSQPTGNALNKKVDWGTSLKGKDDPYERAKIRGLLEKNNISESEVIGSTTGTVNATIEAQVPIIAYGITDRWTAAIAVPFVTTDISVARGFEANENAESFARGNLQGDLNSDHKAYKFENDTTNAIDIKLDKNGYENLDNSNGRRTRLGDIRFINKIMTNQTDNFIGSIKAEVTIPTGEPTNQNRIVDIQSGDGQWDAGLGYAAQYTFNEKFFVVGFAGYLAQLPVFTTRRIFEEDDSKITPDKERVTMDLGDVTTYQATLGWNIIDTLTFINTVAIQSKQADQFRDGKLDSERYRWMSYNTNQEMTTYIGNVTFSTLPLFRAKKFPVPLQATVMYSNVLSGKNVLNDEVYSAQFSLFF